jgi:hypothetical protein
MKAAKFLRGVAARAVVALLFGAVALAVAAPVRADEYGRGPPPHEERDRGHDHRERERHDERYRYYYAPPPETVYAPPPVLYAPPAPPPGLSIIIPFNFR